MIDVPPAQELADVLVVLAGGRSRRFGSDKALARLASDGEPLVQRTLRRLAGVAPRRVVVRASQLLGLPEGVVRIADPRPGAGPLQALAAAFAAAPAPRWFVAPCDLPWLEPAVYARLAAGLPRGAAAAVPAGAAVPVVAVARAPDGLEPLVSIWTPPAARELGAWLAQEPELAVHAAIGRLSRAEIEFADARAFLNVNTPDDLERARGCADATGAGRSR